MLALVLALLAQVTDDPPLLEIGRTIEGEITDADPEIHTPALDARHTLAPTVGQTFLIEVEKPGPYTIELRSDHFDAYLVLRGGDGNVLAENDDGLQNTHARIVRGIAPGRIHVLEACALLGNRGAFELRLVAGGQARLAPKKKDKDLGIDLPKNPLLIRADKNPELKYIQKVMELLRGKKDIQIWRELPLPGPYSLAAQAAQEPPTTARSASRRRSLDASGPGFMHQHRLSLPPRRGPRLP